MLTGNAKQRPFFNKTFIVFINALIFTIAFNSTILVQRYIDYKSAGSKALYYALGEAIFAFVYAFPIIYVLSIPKLFFRLLLIAIYISSGTAVYFIYSLNL